jgi:HSP20 family protein
MALAVRRRETPTRAPQRWDPFQQLEEMLRQLESTWPQEAGDALAWTPPVDIEESEDAWILEAELPGVKQADMNVDVNDNEIVISGEAFERERKGILRRQTRRTGRFEFRAQLPGPIDPGGVEANVEDGVLTVRVRKPEQTRQRRIEIGGPTDGQGEARGDAS